MKSESLVIADQHAAVNTFPGLVHTARHTMGVGFTRRRLPNRKEGGAHGGFHDWGEVVQGSRTGRCDWITSFLENVSEKELQHKKEVPTLIG